MTWRGQLQGDPMDLSILSEVFPDGDPVVTKVDEKHWLASGKFLDSSGAVDPLAAKSLLNQMNGAARVIDSSYRPVSLSGIFQNTEGGVLIAPPAAFATIRLEGRGRLSVGGVPRGDRLLSEAAADPDIATALRIIGKPDRTLSWFDLFKILEVVRAAVGGEAQLVAKGWASSAELDSFRLSSNHPSISGDDARHAKQPGKPSQSKAMASHEGQRLMLHLVAQLVRDRG